MDEETRSQTQTREEVLVKRDKDAAAVAVEATSSIRNSHIMGAIALNTLCILPCFLVSAMGESIRSDLHLDEAVLGFAFSGYWLVASVAAFPMAVLTDRWGAVRALRAAGLGAFVLSIVFMGAAGSGAGLVLALAMVGLAPALATPAVNVVIMSGVRVQRRACAFAAASAGPVAALMVAGATAPLLEESVGWRVAVGVGGLAAALLVVWLRGAQLHRARPAAAASGKVSLRPLMVMMAGVLAGNIALGGATSFAVVAAPTAELDIASVSFVVSACACGSILFRLMYAVMVDRRGSDPFPGAWMMLVAGGVGFVLMAWGLPGTFIVGLVLVLVPGWSWIPLLVHGVTSRYSDAVAPASGVVQGAYFVGGVVGPSVMGVLVTTASYSLAWLVMSTASLVAAISVFVQGRRLPPFRTARAC